VIRVRHHVEDLLGGGLLGAATVAAAGLMGSEPMIVCLVALASAESVTDGVDARYEAYGLPQLVDASLVLASLFGLRALIR